MTGGRLGLNKETSRSKMESALLCLKKMKERLENLQVGYGINDSFLLASVWEEKCPSPDRLPRILVIFVFASLFFNYRVWVSCALALSPRGLVQSAVENSE